MVPYNDKNKEKQAKTVEENWRQLALLLQPKMKEIADHITKCNEQLCLFFKGLEEYNK
jgi:hypothetical protein